MQFHPSFDAGKCQSFVSVSEDMIQKSKSLISSLRSKAAAAEIVSTCKEFVALTRTLDTVLDDLAAQTPGAKAEALNQSKASSKKAVHTLLKVWKRKKSKVGEREKEREFHSFLFYFI